jgi:hypothetical protein
MLKKIDLRKELQHLYRPSAKQVELVRVPKFNFVMVDGQIEPGQAPGTSPAFGEALAALYGVAYTLKFMSKLRKMDPIDYPVMALEALWWVEDGLFDIARPDNWCWRAMILQPDHITRQMFAEALDKLKQKKPSPAVDKLRLKPYLEGLCLQTLHVGPYSTEPATVGRMQAFAAEQGYTERHEHVLRHGHLVVYDHHEIYLGDPRRAKPEKLQTILRHPVKKTALTRVILPASRSSR